MLEREDSNLKIKNEAELQQADETLVIVYMGIGVQILLLAFIFLIIRKDVIGRRKAENNFNESEGKFKNVFENSNVGKSLTTIDGKLRVNKEFCNIVGYSEEELSTLHWKEITHPDDIDENQRVISSLIAGEKEHARYQKRYLHKSGRIVWADLSTFLQKDRNGKPLYFITSIIDITGRKRIEDEIRTLNEELEQRVADRTADLKKTYNVLQESEEKLRTASLYARSLLEASLDPFVTISPDGKITDVNKATELVTGVNRDHLTGSDFSDYFTAPEKAREGYQQAFSHGFVVDYPLAIRHISGSVTEVLYNATVYRKLI
ncbi:MAG: PAS domain S-box protein [Bacteroidetes bacterium]|nr:PAS domain S-box protein [Bacteroidota bacterium]